MQPGVFIPIAEEMGLIGKIGEWVIRSACKAAAEWPDHLTISVNLSAAQFGSGNICEVVASALVESRLAPERLELEITETLLLRDTEEVLADLRKLKRLGVSIVMDDFGTGYSSLNYLWRFPFDKIKIDRSFMSSLGKPDRSVETIVRTIVDLGHSLNMRVTVEGVEDADQVAFTRSVDCDEVQGFFYGRPVNTTDLSVSMLKTVLEPRKAAERAVGT
jgi:EAL domain-containing protein (putative c-di-GMP-specific phosphodiesterase class I)